MTLGWKQAYADLEAYITGNPEIKISRGITILPDGVREEFYRLFDNATQAFLKEQTPDIYADACELSKNYLPEAAKLEKTLKLTEIKTVPRLDWVLGDPVKGASRALFDPLFDLLKGLKTLGEFEHEADGTIRAYWQPLFKRGYESWAILSLANLLSPEKVLAPSWDEIKQACHELQPDEKRGWCEEFVPEPKELERIELGHEGYDPAYMVSDIILYSRDLKKYVSFGANLTDAAWFAKNASESREWIKLRDRGLDSRPLLNWPGLAIYADKEPNEISIVADFGRFLRPEIMVECMEHDDWFQRGHLDKIKTRHDFFKPTLGTFIISRDPAPAEAFWALEPAGAPEQAGEPEPEAGMSPLPETEAQPVSQNIFIISAAGYDPRSLNPIIEALVPAEEKEEEKDKLQPI